MFASEQLFIGGQFSVRGFNEDSLGGDVVGYLRNTVSYTLPFDYPPEFRKLLGVLQIRAGLDVGEVKQNYAIASEEGVLMGAAIGVGLVGGAISADLAFERGLSSPAALQADEDFVRFRISARY